MIDVKEVLKEDYKVNIASAETPEEITARISRETKEHDLKLKKESSVHWWETFWDNVKTSISIILALAGIGSFIYIMVFGFPQNFDPVLKESLRMFSTALAGAIIGWSVKKQKP